MPQIKDEMISLVGIIKIMLECSSMSQDLKDLLENRLDVILRKLEEIA